MSLKTSSKATEREGLQKAWNPINNYRDNQSHTIYCHVKIFQWSTIHAGVKSVTTNPGLPYIRGTARDERLRNRVRDAGLKWFVWRRDTGYTVQWMLNMELSNRRKREKPPRRFLDVVKQDMQRSWCNGGIQKTWWDGDRWFTVMILKGAAD